MPLSEALPFGQRFKRPRNDQRLIKTIKYDQRTRRSRKPFILLDSQGMLGKSIEQNDEVMNVTR